LIISKLKDNYKVSVRDLVNKITNYMRGNSFVIKFLTSAHVSCLFNLLFSTECHEETQAKVLYNLEQMATTYAGLAEMATKVTDLVNLLSVSHNENVQVHVSEILLRVAYKYIKSVAKETHNFIQLLNGILPNKVQEYILCILYCIASKDIKLLVEEETHNSLISALIDALSDEHLLMIVRFKVSVILLEMAEAGVGLEAIASRKADLSNLLPEEDIDEDKYVQRDIMEYGMRFVVDGNAACLVDKILTNIINLETDNDRKTLKIIQKEAILAIQGGMNPRILLFLLNSYVDMGLEEVMKRLEGR
jgi:hypothetical protein